MLYLLPMNKNPNPVINYYHSWESLFGYRKLHGVKHFGYYPKGKETIPKIKAQLLMDEQLAKALSLPVNSTVLDAGCGEGSVAIYHANKHGLRVIGIDLLDFNINRAKQTATRQQLDDKVTFQVASYQKLSFPDNTFEGVYTMETLVHSPDHQQALKEFYRVLKPGGRLVLFEYSLKPKNKLTNAEQKGMEEIRYINKYSAMPALNEFNWDNMEALVNQAGFQQVRLKDITERMLPMLDEFARLARVPYKAFKLLNLHKYIINAMSAVVFSDNKQLFRYNIIIADKPKSH